MRLYEIKDELTQAALDLAAAETDEEIEDAQRRLFAMEVEQEEKLERMGFLIRNFQADAEACKVEAARLTERRNMHERGAERVKRIIEGEMVRNGDRKIATAKFTFWIQRNTASVVIADELSIPAIYKIPQPDKIDKQGIAIALKAGTEIPGAVLSESESIRMR